MAASASTSACAEPAPAATPAGTEPAAAPDRRAFARYEARLQRVIAHVHAHLDEPLDLNALAEIAHLSPHHWHRVYHAMTGETLAGTVKRLRLQRAATELANGTQPVARIARGAGYPDVASFTRIFKASYGLPPARYRAEGGHALFRAPAAAAPDAASSLPSGQVVMLRELPALDLLAVPHRGSYLRIGEAFERLFGLLATRGLARPGMRTLGLYHDDPDAGDQDALRSHAAVAGAAPPPGGADLPSGLQRLHLAAGRHAVLLHQGPYASMRAAYRWLFGQWLPHSGHEVADRPLVEDYLNDPRQVAPNELRTEICLPLRDLP